MSPTPSNAAAAPGGAIPGLDGVRALAVGIVFLAHAGLERIVPGGLGVTIFFVLSGYLITTLMRRELAGRGTLDLGAFYLRRLLRLMPPLVLVTAAAALAARAGWIDGAFTPSGLLSVLFYWGNYFVIAHDFDGVPSGMGVVWSLAVEEHYYLLYPFLLPPLLRAAGPRGAATVLLGACSAVLAWRCFLYAAGAPEAWLTMATDTRIDAILAGGVLALGLNPLDAPRRAAPSPRIGLLLPAACALLLLGTLLLRDPWFRQTLRYSLQSAAVAGLLYSVVAAARSPGWRLLDTRLMSWLGTLSYTIYLSHHLLLDAVAKHWQAGAVPVALLAAALTLLLAEAMRRWVEAPCARLRRRLHQRGGLPAGAAAMQGGA
jgi:peptidoglycan/LPS O-acetylase OafA/YrhL